MNKYIYLIVVIFNLLYQHSSSAIDVEAYPEFHTLKGRILDSTPDIFNRLQNFADQKIQTFEEIETTLPLLFIPAPVAGADVTLTSRGMQLQTTTSDSDGRFDFEHLPRDEYDILVNALTYPFGRAKSVSVNTHVFLKQDDFAEVVLDGFTAPIRGRIIDKNGTPVSGAVLYAEMDTGGVYVPETEKTRYRTISQHDGYYQFEDVALTPLFPLVFYLTGKIELPKLRIEISRNAYSTPPAKEVVLVTTDSKAAALQFLSILSAVPHSNNPFALVQSKTNFPQALYSDHIVVEDIVLE